MIAESHRFILYAGADHSVPVKGRKTEKEVIESYSVASDHWCGQHTQMQ